jgi:adenosylcobinamide-GDP ribazoletransferase
MQSFLVALGFLTIVPVRFRQLPPPETVARARFWFPAVGVFVGFALGVLTAMLAPLDRPLLAAFFILTAWVGLTGAFHIDGFCDVCDGLFAGPTAEERLAILKDPHLGAFGLVGGFLLLLGKFVALGELLQRMPARAPLLVGIAVAVARCQVPLMAAGARYPRPEGTGKLIVEAATLPEMGLNLLYATGLVIALVPTLDPTEPPALLVVVSLAVLGLRALCEQRLGGITGDCLGAGIEMSESVFLLTAAALLS